MARYTISINTDDTGKIVSVDFLEVTTGRKKHLKNPNFQKNAPPGGVAQPDIPIVLREYKVQKPGHYCVIDPTTGNLYCIDIP